MDHNGDTGPAAVECRQLTKVFRRLLAGRDKAVYALREVSLTVHRGQIVGLIGPNGAGKSTLLNLIAGLILPDEGSVTVSGHSARSIAARRGLGYMPEHPAFPGLYSGRAILRYHGACWDSPRRPSGASLTSRSNNCNCRSSSTGPPPTSPRA